MRLVLLLLTGLLIEAQDLPPTVQALVDLARTAPPELAVDSIAMLAEEGAIPSGEPQSKLLGEAFTLAGRAQEPVHLIPVPGIPPDTRAAYRSKASDLRLDALSLQNRVLKLMLKADPALARSWFESIPHPMLDPRPCEDPFIADASRYYEMAAALAQTGFTEDEKKQNMDIAFLETALEQARSPGEVAAFAKSLMPGEWNPAQLDALTDALAQKMETLTPDYRSFTATVEWLPPALKKLPARTVLIEGFRMFLTQQMSAARCDEDFGDARPAVDWFNSDFHADLPEIADTELQPAKRLGSFQAESYYATSDAKHILEAAATAGRSTPLLDFLRDFSAWTPAGSDIDAFHQKIVVLRGLFEALPQGPERDQVMSQCAGILQYSGVEARFPAEWLLQVKSVMDAAREDAPKLLQSFRVSGDAGLQLFAAMSR